MKGGAKTMEIEIKGVTQKEGASGKTFWIFETSEGKASVFESEIKDLLNSNMGKKMDFDKAFLSFDRGEKYNNIRHAKKGAKTATNGSGSTNDDKPSFYVSYSKDVFIALLGQAKEPNYDGLMDRAIALVQKAREAFK